MAKNKKKMENTVSVSHVTCWQVCGVTRTLTLLTGCRLTISTWENSLTVSANVQHSFSSTMFVTYSL